MVLKNNSIIMTSKTPSTTRQNKKSVLNLLLAQISHLHEMRPLFLKYCCFFSKLTQSCNRLNHV